MKTTDLRRSNAIYIYRSICNNLISVSDIAKETEMSEIAVKKILYNLYNNNILSKYKEQNNEVGRPKIYFGLNPRFYSILIKKESTQFSVKEINILGETINEFVFPLYFNGLNESGSLRMLCATLKQSDGFKYNLGIFVIGQDLDKLDDYSLITKTTETQLILDSLYNEDLVTFATIKDEKYLLNHGKIKKVDITAKELSKYLDVDIQINLKTIDDNNLNEAFRLINIIKLEEKI